MDTPLPYTFFMNKDGGYKFVSVLIIANTHLVNLIFVKDRSCCNFVSGLIMAEVRLVIIRKDIT